MRVRVRYGITDRMQHRWYIDRKYWWWPFWITVDYWDSEDVALAKAKDIKHPKITEIS